MIQRFVMPEKQTTQSKSGRKPETDISQKKKKKKNTKHSTDGQQIHRKMLNIPYY